MKKKIMGLIGGIIGVIIILVILGILGHSLYKEISYSKSTSGGPSGPPVTLSSKRTANNEIVIQYIQNSKVISEYSLEKYLEMQPLIKDMPDKGILSLRLYNFNNGERQWENSYILKKNSVVKGLAENPDAEIVIDSKYFEDIQMGLCGAVTKANNNGDVGIDIKISQASFLWKYSGMMKYKSCFGM